MILPSLERASAKCLPSRVSARFLKIIFNWAFGILLLACVRIGAWRIFTVAFLARLNAVVTEVD
ncbi:hypothetical protein GTO27_12765 [Candidatus Bathyarchaeota archaeon]|nr:hypothetical protein [Candidatus Bathyarchaeota archaeon]